MESSNAVIKYLDRHPELEQHPQMVKFKARRDLRRQRRISYINERTAKRQSQANDDSDAEDEPVASTVSPKKTKVTSTKESPAKKKKLKAATPPSDRETKEQAEDEPASDDLPTPIDITKPSSSPSKAKKALPKKVHGKMAAASKATAQAEDSETTESAATAKTLQPATDDDDDDFDALNLAPKGATIITGESSPPPASSPPRQAASVVPKEKRKAASQLFKQAGSSDDEQTQPVSRRILSSLPRTDMPLFHPQGQEAEGV